MGRAQAAIPPRRHWRCWASRPIGTNAATGRGARDRSTPDGLGQKKRPADALAHIVGRPDWPHQPLESRQSTSSHHELSDTSTPRSRSSISLQVSRWSHNGKVPVLSAPSFLPLSAPLSAPGWLSALSIILQGRRPHRAGRHSAPARRIASPGTRPSNGRWTWHGRSPRGPGVVSRQPYGRPGVKSAMTIIIACRSAGSRIPFRPSRTVLSVDRRSVGRASRRAGLSIKP